MFSSRLRARTHNIKQCRIGAKSERLLLSIYNVSLPPNAGIDCPGVEDDTSVRILRTFLSSFLDKCSPRSTVGDGNCMYRAISLGLYGTESYHILIRLLTALEMLENPGLYDERQPEHQAVFGDPGIVTPPYPELIKDVVTLSAFSDIHHMYAASAAIQQPLQSFHPPTGPWDNQSALYTRKIVGRGVRSSVAVGCTLMWSSCTVPSPEAATFVPNHFVVLTKRASQVEAVPQDNTIWIEPDQLEQGYSQSPLPAETSKSNGEEMESVGKNLSDSFASDDPCSQLNEMREDNLSESEFVWSTPTLPRDDLENGCEQVSAAHPIEADLNDEPVEEVIAAPPFVHNGDSSVSSLGKRLPGDRYLVSNGTIRELKEAQFALDEVPRGNKENVFFVVKNDANLESRANGKNSAFWDDCGKWISKRGVTTKTYFIRISQDNYKFVIFRKGQYYTRNTVKGVTVFNLLEPQPDAKDVTVVSRHYSALKADPDYQRRVSWLEQSTGSTAARSYALYEYKGTHPGYPSTEPYTRTRRRL